MTSEDRTHEDHVEPSLLGTAAGLWCGAAATFGVLFFEVGYPILRDGVFALGGWFWLCWLVADSMGCRNAQNMSGLDQFKGLSMFVVPIALGVYVEMGGVY